MKLTIVQNPKKLLKESLYIKEIVKRILQTQDFTIKIILKIVEKKPIKDLWKDKKEQENVEKN